MSIFNYIKKGGVHTRSVTADKNSAVISAIWPHNPDEVTEPDLALKVATVFRCVDIVAGTVASLGINVLRKKSSAYGAYFENDENNPLFYLLNYAPNSRQNAYDMIYNLVGMVLLQGNAYVVPKYSDGVVQELVLVSPGACSYDITTNLYNVTDENNRIYHTYNADEILHFRNVCLDGGYNGISTLHFAAKTLGIATKTDSNQSEMFDTGSTLRGFVSGERSVVEGFGSVQDDQLSAVADDLEKQMATGKRIFQLPGLMKFNQLSLSPADLQLLESKKFNVLEICRFFGVHPDKVYSQTSTNYQASQNSQTVFLSDTLQPLLRKMENEMQVKLVVRKFAMKLKIKFNFEDYYQTDLESKADYYTKMIANGAMTVNDVRIKEGKEPIEGGDKAMISCNVAPIGSAKISGETTTTQPQNNNNQKDGEEV